MTQPPNAAGEIAILAGLELKSRADSRSLLTAEESLDELAELAESAGATIAERILQSRGSIEAATLVGSGKVQEIKLAAAAAGAGVVIFDHDLTPTQQRNLEKALAVKVVDRTQLILDIFATRARTREGRLQVELAQLNYLLPRLAGRGVEMSRLGGGIGTRGPGETQIETDRRRIGRRIKKVNQEIESVRSNRSVHRKQRSSVPLPVVALAGYTNAGKSTLFNRLTRAGVLADSKMFATLDPTIRLLALPSKRQALIGDTVGFIRNLPTTLVRAFRATLEEVKEATLILHLVDASSPHAEVHIAHVSEVLAEIGAGESPQILVLNKADRVTAPGDLDRLRALATGRSVAISALTGDGVNAMLATIDDVLPFDPVVRRRFRFDAADGASIHLLHECARVLSKQYLDDSCEIEADVAQSIERKLQRFLVTA